MTKSCKIASLVNDQKPKSVKPKLKPKARKVPVRLSNVMDGADEAWPMSHDAFEKKPGVPPGQTAFMPNGFKRKKVMRYNQDPKGSCASCNSKMKVSKEHTKVRHLTNGHGKHMTRRASMNVMKDEINNVVRFTHTCQVTVEISLIDISNPQLPGNTGWDPERNWSNHPPVISTNVHQLMENIDKLQSNKQYAVIPSDGIESLIAGTHCPQSVWELHQSLKACMSEHSYVDDDIAAMHHLHSKPCIFNDASIYSPGTVHKMSSYTASSAYS